MPAKPQTIDEYLSSLSDEQQAVLEKLRRVIRAAAPEAEECISYGIPGFRLRGRLLVSFGAAAKHCAFYPGAAPVRAHRAELKAYGTSVGTVRFSVDRPLPVALVRKLVRTRIAEYAERYPACAGSVEAGPKGAHRPGQLTTDYSDGTDFGEENDLSPEVFDRLIRIDLCPEFSQGNSYPCDPRNPWLKSLRLWPTACARCPRGRVCCRAACARRRATGGCRRRRSRASACARRR